MGVMLLTFTASKIFKVSEGNRDRMLDVMADEKEKYEKRVRFPCGMTSRCVRRRRRRIHKRVSAIQSCCCL